MGKAESTEEVVIRTESRGKPPVELTISGATVDLRSPEKIGQLMDLLELPKGSTAHVTMKVSVAVPR